MARGLVISTSVAASIIACVFAGHANVAAKPTGDSAPTLILVYHRFASEVADSMTVKTTTFEWQLRYLAEHGYPVIPSRRVVDCLRGQAGCPQRCSVVITADDGHRSVYSEMLAVVTRFDVPVTLFIYPSAVSRADYALTWAELRELVRSGHFDVQSHSYWHPNFKVEKRRLPQAEYRRFVSAQLARSRAIIHDELGNEVDLLSWPFGIYDVELERLAADAGYVAAFTLESRSVRGGDDLMALPRHLVSDNDRGGAFARLLAGACR